MKAGFISLTKNAHSSIARMFPSINNFPNFHKAWLILGKQKCLKYSGGLEDYDFLFTSVRHPVDRFASSYGECRRRYRYNKSIEEFYEDYLEGNLNDIQAWHTQHQSFHVIPDELDYILKVENFEKDIEGLCKALEVPKVDTVWANKGLPKPKIDKSFRDKIEWSFKPCMDAFNY